MKHSDYLNLTRRLAFLTREADRTREFLTGEVNRGVLLRAVEAVDNEVVGLMDGLVDGFVEANQGRADQGHGATADVRALYEAMAGFLMATETQVNGSVLYPGIRKRTREWMDQATTWFSDLNAQVQAETTNQAGTQPSKRAVVVHPDRAMLSGFFNDEFKATRPGQQSRFDKFYFAISTAGFTATEWGRIAYAIKWNHKIVTDKVRFQPFTTWLKDFFQAIGVELPKDTRQNKYEEPPTGRSKTKDFAGAWLR